MKIKICGLFREEDIDYAGEALPDYIGFVFAESKRQVTPAFAERVRARLPERISPVGVFVDAPAEEIAALYHNGLISLAQLHGREDESFIRRLKEACGVPVIKAVRMNEGVFVRIETKADYVLFDSGAGSGRTFDWRMLPSAARPVFLAGGVNLENIAQAIARQPFCVDVSSGAETNGVKDREKMLALVKAVHAADKV